MRKAPGDSWGGGHRLEPREAQKETEREEGRNVE